MMPAVNKGPVVGIRHVQALLIFLVITTIYLGRLNVDVSVVAMTHAESTNPDFPEYKWTEAEKSYILSSFFWGCIITQLLGGYLCKLFGVKSVIFWAVFVSGVCSGVTPWLIYWGGWGAYCGIRVVMGCAQGVIFPCIYQHLARWSPPAERNRLGALGTSGCESGYVLSMFISGMVAKGPMGWPGISYISSAMAFGFCTLWLIFGANNATESRFVGEAERLYIESSLNKNDNYHKKVIPIPWQAIWTSVPFLSVLVAICGDRWAVCTLHAQIPAYMNGFFNMGIKDNGIFSALPYMARWVMSYIYLIIADFLLRGNWLSATALRKTFSAFASWIPAATLIGIGFLGKDQETIAIVLMILNVGFNSGTTIGNFLSVMDMSPNHASILTGIVNTASNAVCLVTPLVVGGIVKDNTDRTQWQIVFVIAAVIIFVFNCIYLAFGQSVAQPWDAEDFLLEPQTELETDKKSVKKYVFDKFN